MTSPHNVTAPKDLWSLAPPTSQMMMGKILIDGQDKVDEDSLCVGYWAGEPRLASRWDRSISNDKGNPNSTFHPTWYVLPPWMHVGVLAVADISQHDRVWALRFLDQ